MRCPRAAFFFVFSFAEKETVAVFVLVFIQPPTLGLRVSPTDLNFAPESSNAQQLSVCPWVFLLATSVSVAFSRVVTCPPTTHAGTQLARMQQQRRGNAAAAAAAAAAACPNHTTLAQSPIHAPRQRPAQQPPPGLRGGVPQDEQLGQGPAGASARQSARGCRDDASRGSGTAAATAAGGAAGGGEDAAFQCTEPSNVSEVLGFSSHELSRTQSRILSLPLSVCQALLADPVARCFFTCCVIDCRTSLL